MEITIDNRQEVWPLDPTAVELRIQRTLEGLGLGSETELSLVLTTDAEITPLNSQYLGREGPTNVLAFPMQEGEFAGLTPGLLGDVVVSVETARREALDNGLEPEEHLFRLIIHGILHLLGYDHLKDADEAGRMEDLTEKLLAETAPV